MNNTSLAATWQKIQHMHPRGGAYVSAHWKRFEYLVQMVSPLRPGQSVLEVGASIVSQHIRRCFDCSVSVCYHPLEPEWQERFAIDTVHAIAADLVVDPFPFAPEQFDYILFSEVIEHIPVSPVYLLHNLISALKPNGTLLLSTPNGAGLHTRIRGLAGKPALAPLDTQRIYYSHHREYTPQEIQDMVSTAGGVVKQRDFRDFGHYPRQLRPLRKVPADLLAALFRRAIPSLRRYQIAKIGKKEQKPLMVAPLQYSEEFIRTPQSGKKIHSDSGR